jgi:hypothetical protein
MDQHNSVPCGKQYTARRYRKECKGSRVNVSSSIHSSLVGAPPASAALPHCESEVEAMKVEIKSAKNER